MSKPKSKTQPPKTADMYRALFEAAGEAMFVLNNGVISRCNPGALALFGGDAKTLEGRPFESLSPPTRPDGSNPADELKSRQTTALSGVGQRFEWLFRRQNGQTFLAEVGLHGFESDGQQLVLASVRDITQSEDAQAIRALLSKRVQEQAALNEISRAVFEQTDPQAVYELVTQSLVDRFNMSFARIWILDETTNELVLRVSKGEYTHLDGPHSRVPLTSSRKLAWIAGRRAPHITNDLLNDTRVDDKSWVKTSQTVAFAGYPLIAGDDLLGVLGMFSHHPIAEETLAVVQALAVLTGTVVNNRRLFKNMEAALEEANLLRRAVEQSPDGSAVASMEGHILFANRAWANMHGYDDEKALMGKHLSIFHTEEQLHNDVEPFNAQVMQNGAHQGEVGHVRADGSTFPTWMTTALLKDVSGNPVGLVAAAQDITERKRAETERERLLTEVERLAAIVETHPDFIGVGSLKGHALYINPAGLKMMGLPPNHDVTAMVAADFFPPADVAKLVDEAIPTALKQGGARFEEANLLAAGGETTPVEGTIGINHDSGGKPVSFSLTLRDISERKVAEAERDRLMAEVEAAYRQYVRREWAQFLGEQHQGRWRVEHRSEEPQPGDVPPGNGANLQAPIALRGQTIGALTLQDANPRRRWTVEERALVNAVSEQLALTIENLRLFDSTQKRATREHLAREITDKIRVSPDVDSIIQTGLSELAQALGVPRAYIKLNAPPASPTPTGETAD